MKKISLQLYKPGKNVIESNDYWPFFEIPTRGVAVDKINKLIASYKPEEVIVNNGIHNKEDEKRILSLIDLPYNFTIKTSLRNQEEIDFIKKVVRENNNVGIKFELYGFSKLHDDFVKNSGSFEEIINRKNWEQCKRISVEINIVSKYSNEVIAYLENEKSFINNFMCDEIEINEYLPFGANILFIEELCLSESERRRVIQFCECSDHYRYKNEYLEDIENINGKSGDYNYLHVLYNGKVLFSKYVPLCIEDLNENSTVSITKKKMDIAKKRLFLYVSPFTQSLRTPIYYNEDIIKVD